MTKVTEKKNTSKKTNIPKTNDEVSTEDQIIVLLKEILAEVKKLKKNNISAEELFGK
jgi:uncharacterized protein with WD repeat